MKVFLLQHVHILEDLEEDTKIIGVFSSRVRAEESAEILRKEPGFSDFPGWYEACETSGFSISEYEIDGTDWRSGFNSIPRK